MVINLINLIIDLQFLAPLLVYFSNTGILIWNYSDSANPALTQMHVHMGDTKPHVDNMWLLCNAAKALYTAFEEEYGGVSVWLSEGLRSV